MYSLSTLKLALSQQFSNTDLEFTLALLKILSESKVKYNFCLQKLGDVVLRNRKNLRLPGNDIIKLLSYVRIISLKWKMVQKMQTLLTHVNLHSI